LLFVLKASGQIKPYFTSRENSRVSLGSNYKYQFAAKDSAGRNLVFVVKTKPAWLQFNAGNHMLSGKTVGAGQFPVHLQVWAGNDTADQYFLLTVYNKETINILPAGNSITNGTDTFNSYRRELWKMMQAKNYNFDFVGSWSKHHMGGEVPNPDFDMDHEGHSGWTFEHFFKPPDWDSVRGNVYRWLRLYKPDIVLLELGTNDVFQCRKTEDMMKDFVQLIQVYRTANPAVKIFVAQIPPLGDKWAKQDLCGNGIYEISVKALNREISTYAKQYSTEASPVIVVDQFTGVNPAIHMYDDIHPNDAGEKIMAQRWFNAIEKYMKKLK
jgi:hypothetical protein